MDAFVELIPYDETRGYTKRVLGSYFAYAFLYGDSGGRLPWLAPTELVTSEQTLALAEAPLEPLR